MRLSSYRRQVIVASLYPGRGMGEGAKKAAASERMERDRPRPVNPGQATDLPPNFQGSHELEREARLGRYDDVSLASEGRAAGSSSRAD